jgi:hypothetical protein
MMVSLVEWPNSFEFDERLFWAVSDVKLLTRRLNLYSIFEAEQEDNQSYFAFNQCKLLSDACPLTQAKRVKILRHSWRIFQFFPPLGLELKWLLKQPLVIMMTNQINCNQRPFSNYDLSDFMILVGLSHNDKRDWC